MNRDSTMKTRSRWRWPLAYLVLVACWSACGIVPRQGWSPDRGPVVPHDSFPADCELCHEGGGWHRIVQDFSFDHEAETGVALEGAHAGAGCLLCHNDRGPVASFAARGCAGCHVDEHRGQLGKQCEDCHEQDDWRPQGMIARHQSTRFPLVGAHAATACFRCHEGAQVGNFAGADPRCETCHGQDLLRAASPDHGAQGWVRDCGDCHVPIAWRPARFAHPSSLPLVGGHALDCSACHVGNVFTGLSPVCSSCHLGDYNGTTDPNHQQAGFGTDCQVCHTINGWSGASFTHSVPTNGPHNVSCSECHTTPGNFQAFSCTHCHKHDQSVMGDKHKEVNGYTWVSSACLNCHPNLKH